MALALIAFVKIRFGPFQVLLSTQSPVAIATTGISSRHVRFQELEAQVFLTDMRRKADIHSA